MLPSDITIVPLADHVSCLATIQHWFETEWPGYYGPGGRGDAAQDLRCYANRDGLPFALLALHDDAPCGIAALKTEPFAACPDLSPWLGAAYVRPAMRRNGIGARLVRALEARAWALGCPRIYCATATAATLLARCGWSWRARVPHEGGHIDVYEKAPTSR